MKRRVKRKTVWAYLDGKKLVDVVQAALDNNMMVDDLMLVLVGAVKMADRVVREMMGL